MAGEEVQTPETARKRPAGAEWTWWSWLLAAPAVVLTAVEATSRGGLAAVGGWMLLEPLAAALGYACLLALTAFLALVTGRLWLGALLTALPAFILAAANYFKVAANGTVLLLSELAMATHLNTLTGFLSPELGLPWPLVGAGLAIAAVIVTCALSARSLPRRLEPWRIRTAALLAAAAVGATVFLAPWSFYVGDALAAQEERDSRLGLLGGLYGSVLSRFEQMSGADESAGAALAVLETLGPEEAAPASEVRPNVVLLMSESFCDPSVMLPTVDFAADPLPNLHALAQSFPSGTFYSNTYGGGTGNVELEVLTGVPLALLPEGEDLTTLSAPGAYERIPSVVRCFAQAGYATEFIHSYTPELYNRAENFPALGFQKLMFAGDFPADAPRAGGYLSDAALTDAMISAFEEKEAGEPLFLYGLSMENHQPIFGEKFGGPSGLEPRCEALDEEALGMVDALGHALRDADAALAALIDYLADYPEPVLLVFWGDHLPSLYFENGGGSVFSATGYVPTADTAQWDAETMKRMHSTSYLVWNNYGGEIETPEAMGALGLGARILKWAGVERPAWFRWSEEATKTVALYRKRLYIDAQGVPQTQPPQEGREVLDTYRALINDMLYAETEK